MRFATTISDACVQHQTLATIVGIRAKRGPVDPTLIAWLSIKRRNACVQPVSLVRPIALAVASTTTNANEIPLFVQRERFASTLQAVTRVNVRMESQAIPTPMAVHEPTLWRAVAMIRIHAPMARIASSTITSGKMCAFVGKAFNVTPLHRNAWTSMNVVWSAIDRLAEWIRCAKICQAATNASVRRISMEIRIWFAKNAAQLNVNAKRRTNLLAEVAFWLDAKTEANVHRALNAFRLRAVSAIVPVRKAIALNRMVRVSMLMNVLKAIISVALALNVSTNRELMNVYARPVTMAMHITDNAQHHNEDALPIRNVEQTSDAYNLASVFVRHHSSWTPVMATNVKIHARDIHAESMRNAHHLTHHSVCVKPVSKEIHFKVVSMKMNALLMAIRVHMGRSVSIKRAATNACVQKEWLAIHTKAAVLYKAMMESARANVTTTTNVQIHSHACKELVLVRAKVCCVDQMHIANQKDMPLGVGVALDLLKIKMENVFPVSEFFC